MKFNQIFGNWRGDVLGGIMTAVVALPVAMAFGVASGMGAAAGLYGAMACGFCASVFGGTRGQQSGPTGPIAVIVAGLLIANQDRMELVLAATIIAGLLQIIFGRLGWGDLVRYLPYPVISGFMTGIALIIIILHINPLLGISGSKEIIKSIQSFANIPNQTNTVALAIGIATFVLMYAIKFRWKKAPAALISLFITTLASVMLKLEIPRIGEIPSQLPIPHIPPITVSDASIVALGALTIAVLGSIDSLLTSLIADKLVKDHHNSNQELIGQGLGNVATGLLGGLAGAGSTTRTLANIDAGGRTALAGIVYSSIIFAVIAFFGSLASIIPLSALAAILIALGIGIIDWRMLRHFRAAPRADLIVMCVVLFLTVAVDLISAVLIGTAVACALFAKNVSDSSMSVFGPASSVALPEQLAREVPPSVLKTTFHYQSKGPLFFGETRNLTSALQNLGEHKLFVLNLHAATFIDQSCAYFLEDAVSNLEAQGLQVVVLGTNDKIKASLEALHCNSVLEREYDQKYWNKISNSFKPAASDLISSGA